MMTKPFFIYVLLAAFLIPLTGSAQELSWRKHRSLAQRLEAEGQYFDAAENYRMAWEKKQSKAELIYLAAENYYKLNDYRNAADAYQHVDAHSSDDPLVMLKYARSLKQDGQYDKARTIFQELRDSYTGNDKAILEDIVRTELRGIDIARNLSASMDRRMEILHPSATVNSESEEFGPVSISDDLLYFTSTMGGQARIYETNRSGRNWSKAATPAGFPLVQGGQYGNGSISPDDQRFYFSICNNDAGWNGLNTRCEIYVIKRSTTGWGQPEKLPEYINAPGVNTTHPYVVHLQGQEYLYFSSNRDGGRGGQDIWYVARDLGKDDLDYTFPVNLGPGLNTLGDEVTPYYDADEGMLYFSSNGLPSIGGHDIYKSIGNEVNWETPVNAGLPLNSGADDYGYTRNRSGYGGYFVSNRPFGGEKTDTRHYDIFEYSLGGRQITLKANAYDQASGALLNNIAVSLYQLFEDGSENLLITKNFDNGSYLFELLPNRRFRVEINQPGYQPAGYVFATDDPSTYSYGQPLFMQITGNPDDPTTTGNSGIDSGNSGTDNANTNSGTIMTEVQPPMVDNSTNTTPANTGTNTNPVPVTNPGEPMPGNTAEEYTSKGTSAKDNMTYISNAPRFQGTYFKVQVAAVKTFKPEHANFQAVSGIGNMETEQLPDRNMTRVLVANFFSQQEAQNALSSIKSTFPNAYIVKYDNGVRYGRVNF